MNDDEIARELLRGAPPASPKQKPANQLPSVASEIPPATSKTVPKAPQAGPVGSLEMWMACQESSVSEHERRFSQLEKRLERIDSLDNSLKIVAALAAGPYVLFMFALSLLGILAIVGSLQQ